MYKRQLLDLILREEVILETLQILFIEQDTFFLRMVVLLDHLVTDLLYKNQILRLDLPIQKLRPILVVVLLLMILNKEISVSLLMQHGMEVL